MNKTYIFFIIVFQFLFTQISICKELLTFCIITSKWTEQKEKYKNIR